MSVDEISERLIVGFESFVSLGISFISTVTGAHIQPLSTPAICHLYGSETPTTEFFLETRITDEDDVCVASDWLVLLFQFLVIIISSWLCRWLLLEPLARKILGRGASSKSHAASSFARALVQAIIHVLFAYGAWHVLSTKSWLLVPEQWSERGVPTVAPDVKFCYLLYTATCLSELLVSLQSQDNDKVNTWLRVLHLMVVIALVLGCAMTGYLRVGCVLFILMDLVNPVLQTANMFQHLGYQFVANHLFEVYGIAFFLTRNVLLSYIVSICLRDLPQEAKILKGLFVALVVVQALSLVSIIQTARNQYFTKGSSSDFRSEVCDAEFEPGRDRLRGMIARKRRWKRKHKKQ